MGLDGPWPLFSLLEFEPFRSHSFFLHSEGFLLFLWLVRFALTSRITGYLSKGGFWVAWLLTPVSWKCPDCALHFAPVSQGSPLPTDVILQWLAGLVTTPVSRPWVHLLCFSLERELCFWVWFESFELVALSVWSPQCEQEGRGTRQRARGFCSCLNVAGHCLLLLTLTCKICSVHLSFCFLCCKVMRWLQVSFPSLKFMSFWDTFRIPCVKGLNKPPDEGACSVARGGWALYAK